MIVPARLTRLLRRFARSEDGSMVATLLGMLPIMLFFLTLVEASRVYSVKNELQATADAAAMASVWQVPNGLELVRRKAIDFADYNMPPAAQYGGASVLVDADVKMGTWDGADDVFSSPEPNAVKVKTRGEMPLLFAGALRSLEYAKIAPPESFKPSATAIARLRQDQCYFNGFVAGGRVDMNSSNNFSGNFCVYGLEGVTMNQSNEYAPGTEVGMANLADLIEGGNNPGLPEALAEKVVAPPAANAAQLMIEDLLAGNGPMGLPEEIDSWPPTNGITPGKLYHVLTAVDIKVDNGQVLQNVGIISDISIRVRSPSKLSGVTLGSPSAVNIDSNVVFGDASFCTTGAGEGQSIILSGGNVTGNQPPLETNSKIDLYGVQMISDGTIEMNSNLKIIGASIQSSGDIVFNSQFNVAGCLNETSPNVTGGETMVAQLVD